jgi:chloride channel protein, CIC family
VKSPYRDDSRGIPVSPSMQPALAWTSIRGVIDRFDRGILKITALSIGLGLLAPVVARLLVSLIHGFTNLFYYARVSVAPASPSHAVWGSWAWLIPVVGGLIVGLMARFGSKAIRGHGIPEAMEQVLTNESRIPFRMTFLKPLSAAIAIGSGGPFGAEGPIIATGGALGSLVGQLVPASPDQRKTLLASGAAAGMTAIFGSPISAVLLAVELLLFEFHAPSLIPVALSAAVAAAMRLLLFGSGPAFLTPELPLFAARDLPFFLVEGFAIGLAAVLITKLVYFTEDAFERAPIHWMWWPALGGAAVGLLGLWDARTLGVGYDNIEKIVAGDLTGKVLVLFCALKLVSWAVSLGSGTSGGTLAPLLTIGGGLGATLAAGASRLWPAVHPPPSISAVVGMAALFAGASRALLTSVVFAFEATHQQGALVPLLAGCSVSYLTSYFLMRNTIMTEKISRRGVAIPTGYRPSFDSPSQKRPPEI